MSRRKPDIITFKVDSALREAMRGIANRSEFIRAAVLSALDSTCPLCMGSGKLSANQKNHLKALLADHAFEECGKCHELQLVCARGPVRNAHARMTRKGTRK